MGPNKARWHSHAHGQSRPSHTDPCWYHGASPRFAPAAARRPDHQAEDTHLPLHGKENRLLPVALSHSATCCLCGPSGARRDAARCFLNEKDNGRSSARATHCPSQGVRFADWPDQGCFPLQLCRLPLHSSVREEQETTQKQAPGSPCPLPSHPLGPCPPGQRRSCGLLFPVHGSLTWLRQLVPVVGSY